jgi:glucokinase
MSEIYASVDLGGTKISCALATDDGRMLAEKTIPTDSHEGPEAVLTRIADAISELCAQAPSRPLALGIGVPGLADIARGVTTFLPNLTTTWPGVAVRDRLAPMVGCPVYLLNDVRTATLGEMTFGHGRNVKTMAFFALGTGVGGGLVIDGHLRLGPMGMAGELGHQTIIPDGARCGCGNRGCLETVASGPALTAQGVWLMQCGRAPKLHELTGGDPRLVTPREMATAAAAGDEAVAGAIRRAAEYIGIGVANIIAAIYPELIVLGGGVAEIGAPLFEVVRETIAWRIAIFPVAEIRIEPSMLGEKAGLWGGIALAMRGGLLAELAE